MYTLVCMKLMLVCRFSSIVMIIMETAMIIWGSVFVFGAWANWTDDLDKYLHNNWSTNPNLNFCEYTPMMTAFVILLLKVPVTIAILCFCAWCCGAASEQNSAYQPLSQAG